MIPKVWWIVSSVIILLACFAVTAWANMRMNCFRDWSNRKKRREYSKKKHPLEYYLWFGAVKVFIPVFSIISLCSIGAFARFNVDADDYVYIKNELETQHDIGELFSEESPTGPEEGQENEEQIDSLCIPKRFINAPINEEMVDYFTEVLSAIYVNGSLESNDLPPEIAQRGAKYESSKSGSVQEAIKYRDQYNKNPNQALLYQYGRSLSEYQPSGADSFEIMYEVMAESFNSLKFFLMYSNRNVNCAEKPVIIDASWIAFLEGKLFLRIGKVSVGDKNGVGYSNCFLVEAFVSFNIALNSIDPSNKDYAKIAYYVGNSGETLLGRIDKADEKVLYYKIGNMALQGYNTALECYQSNPDFFKTERGILDHIDAGIKTLRGLGIAE